MCVCVCVCVFACGSAAPTDKPDDVEGGVSEDWCIGLIKVVV